MSDLEALASRDVADDLVLTASTVADVAARLSSTRAAVPTWFALHEDPGNAGFYAHVARAAAGAVDLRTIGPDVGERRSLAIEDVAAEAVDRIRARSPVGPYRVLGFCFAGPVALEVARRLEAAGEDVAGLALLGISPLEFPGLVDPAAVTTRRRARVFRQRARAHLAEARRRGVAAGSDYLLERTVARAGRVVRRSAGVPDPVAARAAAVRAYPARPFSGAVLVVLGRSSAATYTRRPDVAWRRLGRTVEVTVIPGDDHAMLVGDGAAELARALVGASRTGESMAPSTSHAGAGVSPGSVAGGVP